MVIGLALGSWENAWAQYSSYGAYTNPAPDSTIIFLDSARVVGAVAPAQALPLLYQALSAAIVNRNPNGEARAYLASAEIQQRLGRPNDARENLLKCKHLFAANPTINTATNSTYSSNSTQPARSTLDPNILRQASLLLTQVYEQTGQFQEAFQESETSLKLMPPTATRSLRNEVLRTQARLGSKMGKNKDAEQRLEALLRDERQAGDLAGECETLIALGEHHQRANEGAKAKGPLEKAIELAGSNGFKEKEIAARQALAAIYHAEGNLQKELDLRNAVVVLNGGTTNLGTNSLQNIAIGNAYLEADLPDLAAKYVETGVTNLASNNLMPTSFTSTVPASGVVVQPNSVDLQAGADSYRLLAEGFLKKSEFEKSLEYYKKYAILQDSVKAVQARELAAAIALSTDLGKNEERVQLLERERALADASIDLLRQDQQNKGSQILARNLIIGILIAFMILGIVAGLILVRNTRARRRADKLLALQSMTGQMNPHFIFNALNSVNEFISQNDERAANRYLTAFSRLMRKVMDGSKQEFIPLTDEVEMLKLYLSLEHARFKHQFEYRFEVDAELENAEFQVPPMIVQPYIENAIWHGLRYRAGGGKLLIHFERVAHRLQITIQDDGIGIAKSKDLKTTHQKRQHSMGMKNIGMRMQLMNEIYHAGMHVEVDQTHAGAEYPGTTVRISIPQNFLRTVHSPAILESK